MIRKRLCEKKIAFDLDVNLVAVKYSGELLIILQRFLLFSIRQ